MEGILFLLQQLSVIKDSFFEINCGESIVKLKRVSIFAPALNDKRHTIERLVKERDSEKKKQKFFSQSLVETKRMLTFATPKQWETETETTVLKLEGERSLRVTQKFFDRLGKDKETA